MSLILATTIEGRLGQRISSHVDRIVEDRVRELGSGASAQTGVRNKTQDKRTVDTELETGPVAASRFSSNSKLIFN